MIQRTHIIIFTIIAFLVMSLPHFHSEDMSRDGKVDLEDAVLLVRQFANTAYEPAAFGSGVKNAVSALRVTAGLNPMIKTSGSVKSMPSYPDNSGIISSYTYPMPSDDSSHVSERIVTENSIIISPEVPPPRYG